jgi:FAD/FMN-containing dehydrogenase
VGDRNLYRSGSRTVVRPPDESALASILRVANSRSIPVVTDQTGFRAPAGAVQIDLSGFEGITRISTHSLVVEVEAGVRVERLEEMLRRHGLTLGPIHPRASSRSIGAALARNLLIRRGLAFGDPRAACFAVRGLLANGAPLDTRPVPRSATGPELDRALIGGDARWGIITRATLRTSILPVVEEEIAFGFPALEAAVECARVAIRSGVRPAAARVLSTGVAAFYLVGAQEERLKAELAVLSGAARGLEGKPVESRGLAVAGRFDAVVEVEVPWTQAAELVSALQTASGGEVWIDFLAPEAVTLVTRVLDRNSRHATIDAASSRGARVIAGRRAPDPLGDQEDPYLDVVQRISALLDPAGVFRGRSGEAAP